MKKLTYAALYILSPTFRMLVKASQGDPEAAKRAEAFFEKTERDNEKWRAQRTRSCKCHQ